MLYMAFFSMYNQCGYIHVDHSLRAENYKQKKHYACHSTRRKGNTISNLFWKLPLNKLKHLSKSVSKEALKWASTDIQYENMTLSV